MDRGHAGSGQESGIGGRWAGIKGSGSRDQDEHRRHGGNVSSSLDYSVGRGSVGGASVRRCDLWLQDGRGLPENQQETFVGGGPECWRPPDDSSQFWSRYVSKW